MIWFRNVILRPMLKRENIPQSRHSGATQMCCGSSSFTHIQKLSLPFWVLRSPPFRVNLKAFPLLPGLDVKAETLLRSKLPATSQASCFCLGTLMTLLSTVLHQECVFAQTRQLSPNLLHKKIDLLMNHLFFLHAKTFKGSSFMIYIVSLSIGSN